MKRIALILSCAVALLSPSQAHARKLLPAPPPSPAPPQSPAAPRPPAPPKAAAAPHPPPAVERDDDDDTDDEEEGPATRSLRRWSSNFGERFDFDVDLDDLDLPALSSLGRHLLAERGDDDHGFGPRPHIAGGHFRDSDSHDDGDEDPTDATAKAHGNGSVALAVKGPVHLRLRASAGDIEVVASDKPQVAMKISEAPPEDLALFSFGDRVEARFRGRSQLRRGHLRVEVPKGSQVDVSSMSGDIQVHDVGGEVRIRTMSGDVKIGGVGRADVQTISGDLSIDGASGPVRVHTVSGHAKVKSTSAAPQLEFQSASGDLDWNGECGKDCHVSAETVSGDLQMALDAKSSFELSYTSHSGDLRDELQLAVKHAPKKKHGMPGGWLEATYGKGEGVIEADAFSGSLLVRKR